MDSEMKFGIPGDGDLVGGTGVDWGLRGPLCHGVASSDGLQALLVQMLH